MTIHVAVAELVVFETSGSEQFDENEQQAIVRTALEEQGLEQWSSMEIEEFTYQGQRLIFASPIKIFIPNFLAALLN